MGPAELPRKRISKVPREVSVRGLLSADLALASGGEWSKAGSVKVDAGPARQRIRFGVSDVFWSLLWQAWSASTLQQSAPSGSFLKQTAVSELLPREPSLPQAHLLLQSVAVWLAGLSDERVISSQGSL